MSGFSASYGFQAGEWRKNPLLLGYGSLVYEQINVPSAPAGTNTLSGTAVPANTIYVIQLSSCLDNTSSPSKILFNALIDSNSADVMEQLNPLAATSVILDKSLVLEAGDILRGIFFGVTAGDNLFFRTSYIQIPISG